MILSKRNQKEESHMRSLKLTVGNYLAMLEKNNCTKMVQFAAMNSRMAKASAYAYAENIDATVLGIAKIPGIVETVEE